MIKYEQLIDYIELIEKNEEFNDLVNRNKHDPHELIKKVCEFIKDSKVYKEKEVVDFFDYSENKVLKGSKLSNSLQILNPSQLPDISNISGIYEPYIKMDLITPEEYLGKLIELINDSRGNVESIDTISLNQLKIDIIIPLSEVIVNFYDELKSITKGYASMNYEFLEYRLSSLVRMNILLNGKIIDPLSVVIHKDKILAEGKRVCEKLKELIPRQQIEVVIQAAENQKIIARETIKPFRKDVTAGMYGGDITRRKKLLEKQKDGKKRMKSFGSVNVPKEVFVNVLKK